MSLLKEHALELKKEFRDFAQKEIAPGADLFEETEILPKDLIIKIAEQKYLGSFLPEYFGGREIDFISYGYLTEEFGKASSSARSLLTVQDMLSSAIFNYGTNEQKEKFLPKLTSGKAIGSFCVTEELNGSNLKSPGLKAVENGGGYLLNGKKKWISFGAIADLFLVLGAVDDKPTTFLIPRETEGLSTYPIHNMLGLKASMLADVEFKNCFVPKENILGPIGGGFNFVVSNTLRLGRYSVAWGCVGISQACLDESLHHSKNRIQFDKPIIAYQLVQEMITNMITNTKASRLLCIDAGKSLQKNHHESIQNILIAKYFSSRAAVQSSSDAVQIHGALGCSSESHVQRYFRDAKIMEIIEGSTQIHQILIAKNASAGI